MKDTTSSEDINYQTQSSNFDKRFELIVLTELYVFSAAVIVYLVLVPAIMWLQGEWIWLYAIGCPIIGIAYWCLPFQEFQERFKYSIGHISDHTIN